MATKLILLDCQITVNGVIFSDHVSSVEVSMKKKGIDTTNFASNGTETQQGLSTDTFVVEFQQDFNAAEVDATLYPLYSAGTVFTVAARPVTAAISATNPEYSGQCIMLDYQPLSGKVGELSTTKVTFNVNGSIARATS